MDANIKSTVTALFDKDVEYDTRAMGYCVGRRLALLGTGQDIVYDACPVFPYSSAAGTWSEGDFAVTPGPNAQNAVITAYAHIGHECGLRRIFVLEDAGQLVSDIENRHYWLQAYMRVANQLAQDAKIQGVLGEWLFAFARGVSCVLKLWGHTDEGGYARCAMMEADYPAPCGWVNASRDQNAFKIFSNLRRPDEEHALADCVDLLLQSAGLLHSCDPYAQSMVEGDAFITRIVSKHAGSGDPGNAAPADFPNLIGVLDTWMKAAIKHLPTWQDQPPDTLRHHTNPWRTYVGSDRPDRHFRSKSSYSGVFPYCWVEACCINLSKEGCRIPGPGGPNCPRVLKYMTVDATVQYDGEVRQSSYVCPSDSMHVNRLISSRRVREGIFPLVLASEVSAKAEVRGSLITGNLCGRLVCSRSGASKECYRLRDLPRGWTGPLEEPPPVHGCGLVLHSNMKNYSERLKPE